MALSNDLISQFVKITNDNKPVKDESTIYGTTVNYNGGIYVRIDGSDRLTPVKNTTSDVLPDERVMVLIKNHTALITGNLTSPAARIDTVKDLDTKVDEQGNVIAAHGNEIYAIDDKIAAINNTITAQDNELYLINDKIVALDNTVTAQNNELYEVGNRIALIDNTVTAQGNKLDAINSRISTMSDTITSQGNDIYAIGNKISVIDSSFQIKDGVVTGIKGVDTEWITTETLEAAIIDTDQIKGDYASFKNMVTDELIAAKGWMLEGSIGDAQISSLNANKLRAGTIDTAIVTVAGTDGRLQISDNTIRISDGSQVRVQIGKDASDDYTLAVWDADGNLIWDALGATENTIQRKIIRDKMVAEDAAIQALKIDFQSFDTALTDQGVTISGTVVQVGSKTLNVALSEQTQALTEQGETLTDHGAKIAANEKAISLRVTSQEFTQFADDADARITDSLNRLSTAESSITALQGQIALKVEQTDIDKSLEGYSTTSQMNAAIEVSKSGILNTVSSTYATQDSVEEISTTAEQAADKISWLVKSGTSSTNFTLTDRTAELITQSLVIKDKTGASTIISGGQMDINQIFAQDITATGTIRGVNLVGATGSFSGSVTATDGYIGDLQITSGYLLGVNGNVQTIVGTDFISIGIPNNAHRFVASSDGTVNAYNIYANGLIDATGSITSAGNIKAASMTSTGSLTAASATVSGSLKAASMTVTGSLTAASVTLKTGGLQLPTHTGTSWANSPTFTKCIVATPHTNTSYYPIIRQDTKSGNIFTLGGFSTDNERFGIFGCKKGCPTGTYDYGAFLDVTNGTYYLVRCNVNVTEGDVRINGGLRVIENFITDGSLTASGKIYTSDAIEVDGTVHLHNVYTYQSTEAANVRVGLTGRIARASSSSVRYKDLVSVLSTEDIEPLYDIPVHWFKYKEGYIGTEDERYRKTIPGFIVEDWEGVMPIAIDHNPDGSPEMWNNNIVVPLMFEMIKNEHNRITEVSNSMPELYAYAGRVVALENTVENLREQLYEARNELHDLRAELAEQRAA